VCRTQLVIDETAARRIVDAAVACFREQGYAGTTVRDIAARAEVPVARIYEQHTSKRALLAEIVHATYDRLTAQTLSAVADDVGSPAARLDAAIWAQSDFHARHADESHVAQAEGRSLDALDAARIADKRRRLESLVSDILAEGIHEGHFTITDPVAVSRALLAMCAAIPSWYDPAGHQTPRAVARTYCDLAARMTGRRPGEVAPPPGQALLSTSPAAA
jgi:AcrR family transcriptional regulator